MAGTDEVLAPPSAWGQWRNMRGHTGGSEISYRVTTKSISNAPSSFSIEIQHISPSGLKTVTALGPGDVTVKAGGGVGTDRIRFRSHGLGQIIQFVYT